MKVEQVNRPQHFNSCLAATDTAVLILGIHHKEQHKHLQGKEKEFSHWWPRHKTDFYSQGPNVLAAPKADLSAQPLL